MTQLNTSFYETPVNVQLTRYQLSNLKWILQHAKDSSIKTLGNGVLTCYNELESKIEDASK